jgi:HlyD family type I secretion membrane fusion protein
VLDRSTLYVLTAFIAGVIAFISFFQIDRIVTATGRIVAMDGAITVQPYGEGIIKTIEVKVGQVVKKGQVLATLDATFAEANLVQLQAQVASARAGVHRLEAQEAGTPYKAADDGPYEKLQETMWLADANQYKSGVENFDQQIAAIQAKIAGLQHDVADFTQRLKIANEIEGMRSTMQQKGYESRLVLLTATDTRVELQSNLSDSQNALTADQHTLESLKAQREAFIEQWHTTNLTNLVTIRNQLDAAEQNLAKAAKMSELTKLVSPQDAIVASIPKLTGGAVASDAQPLFSLVPLDAALEAEVQIDAKDAGFVSLNDRVTIKFDTFQYLEHGTADGVVRVVTQDSFVVPDNQDAVTGTSTAGGDMRDPYFDARIKITAVNLHDVPPDFRVTPGMTLQTDIIVGQRTIMWYLLGGALRSGAEAMHEP